MVGLGGNVNLFSHEIIVGKKSRLFGATDIQQHMAELIHKRCMAAVADADGASPETATPEEVPLYL